MRQVISSGSVKAFFLNREEILKRLLAISKDSSRMFPEIQEVRLIGSIARGENTGLSDVDIFILVDNAHDNPIERIKPYFNFFSDKIDISIDILVATKEEAESSRALLQESLLLYSRYS